MKKFYKLTFAIAFFMMNSFVIFAQEKNAWKLHVGNDHIVTDKSVARKSFPTEFKLFELNFETLSQELYSITDNRNGKHTTIITIPNVDGNFEQFEMVEASNFEPALQARFPEIRAFSGKGITDKYATIKLSLSPSGIQTMMFRTDRKNEFIEAYSQDHKIYAVFNSQRNAGQLPWTCSAPEHAMASDLNNTLTLAGQTQRNTGDLKTMRLAQSVNAEYSNYFGATSAAQVNLVLAAVNATITRCNGVYEKDLAVHLNLISNTTSVFYYAAASDPYTTLANWNTQLQTTLTSVIGEANYDIGHMFGASGGGGNAGCIGCICVNGQKGSGITSPADAIPQGDNFDIDYVVHEVGHQMGGNHTFSMSNEGSGVNKEVGSGITIMGYAGITSQDVAPHSIDIFHESSIDQIQTNLNTKTCPITTSITANNATPVVASNVNRTIPISTPFALTGSATDANTGDALTYCWEQNDNASAAQTNASSVASITKATGPNWISFSPSASPTRLFPKLSTILAGQNVTGPITGGDAGTNIEALSSVARTLNFRLTVRDNSPYSSTAPVKVGQTAFKDVVITVSAASGPFSVTAPNTNVSWAGSTTQTITWNVNNTTAAPVSCAKVKISLSTDGGQTFPIVLNDSTANDGTEAVTIPNNPTTTARIKVEAVGNIFFDISNANFTITQATTGFSFGNAVAANITCGSSTSASTSISTTSNGGFTTPINLVATAGVPAGTNVTFGTTPLTPGNTSTITLNNTSNLTPGTYPITITGTAGAVTQTATVSFVVAASTPPTITTQPNASTSVCVGSTATFTTASSTSGVNYQWQVSTDGGTTWTNISGATSASYSATNVALSSNNYKYRAVITTQCGLANSNVSTLTVNVATAITNQPSGVTVCSGSNATFSSTATGNGVTYQWQVSTDAGVTWNNVTGATNASYTINGTTTALNNNQYRVVASVSTGACPGSLNSNAATLTVNATPVLTTTSSANQVCAGQSVTLNASGANTYSWAPGNLSGASITVTPALNPNNPGSPLVNTYTLTGTNTNTCVSTTTVSVTVNPLPVVTFTASPANVKLLPGRKVTLKAGVTPSTGFNFIWRRNGQVIANNSDSLVVDIQHLGTYSVEANGTNGLCNKTSQDIVITDSVETHLFVFPNPNRGSFHVSYYNIFGGLSSFKKQIITIYDSHGARVYNQAFSYENGWSDYFVNMPSFAKGTYVLVLSDANGIVIDKTKLLIGF